MGIAGFLLRDPPIRHTAVSIGRVLDQDAVLIICRGIKTSDPMRSFIETTSKPDPATLALHRSTVFCKAPILKRSS